MCATVGIVYICMWFVESVCRYMHLKIFPIPNDKCLVLLSAQERISIALNNANYKVDVIRLAYSAPSADVGGVIYLPRWTTIVSWMSYGVWKCTRMRKFYLAGLSL